jgi:hypothetical protein
MKGYLTSWILFLITVLLLDWSNARPYHLLVGWLAFPGVIIAAAWSLWKGRWAFAALAISALTVLSYTASWGIEAYDRYLADPTPGLLGTIAAQVRIPRLLFTHRIAHNDYLGALYEAYWQVGMPVLQLVFVFALVQSLLAFRHAARG